MAFGNPKEEFADGHFHDVHGPEWLAWTPMLLLIVVFGVYPNWLFNITDHTVAPLMKVFGH